MEGKVRSKMVDSVVMYASVHALCAVVVKKVLELEPMDVKATFLDGGNNDNHSTEKFQDKSKPPKDDIAHLGVGDDIDNKSLLWFVNWKNRCVVQSKLPVAKIRRSSWCRQVSLVSLDLTSATVCS